MVFRSGVFLLLPALLLHVGCSDERDVGKDQLKSMAGGELKEVIPVSGIVSIDGTPTAGVNIYAYSKASGLKAANQTRTEPDGTYCWATYEPCDGLPPGEYRLAFAHVPKEGHGNKQGEDLLRGKYRDPTKNDFTLQIKSGEPQTEVNYDLKK